MYAQTFAWLERADALLGHEPAASDGVGVASPQCGLGSRLWLFVRSAAAGVQAVLIKEAGEAVEPVNWHVAAVSCDGDREHDQRQRAVE